jgi:hypothetical protein
VVRVLLERDWTDDDGVAHSAGDVVNVDWETMRRLEQEGVVRGPVESDEASTGPELDDTEW